MPLWSVRARYPSDNDFRPVPTRRDRHIMGENREYRMRSLHFVHVYQKPKN
jgi:hypothetical protein